MKTALVALTISVIATTHVNAASNQSKRLWGKDRYETSSAISKEGWTGTSDYAVIVNGENFPDALGAATLAKKYNAPILLTKSDSLDTNSFNELKRLSVKKVLIIGGSGSVNPLVEKSIQDMEIETLRYQGQDRDATSVEVAQTIGTANGIIVAIDGDFTDALSVAPIAAKLQMPIILVKKDVMLDSVKSFISNGNIQKTYILGGNDIISDAVASQFPNIERISGNDKYERNINIIKAFSDKVDFSNICFAYSEKFPDALSGSAYAAIKGNPIILVGGNMNGNTGSFIKNKIKQDTNITAFGGTAGVTDNDIKALTGTANNGDLATLLSNANDYFINSDFEKLIDVTTKIISLDPSNSKAYAYRAYAYSEIGQIQKGIDDCTKAIKTNPNDNLAYAIRGCLYEHISQFDKSKEDYNKAIILSGDSIEFYWARGNAYIGLKKYDEAKAELNKVITLNPKLAMIYNDLAVVTRKSGDTNGALSLYKKAIEINPNLSDAYLGIGDIYTAKKDYQTAISYYNKFIELNNNYYIGYFCRGTAYYYANQNDEAIADLEKSIKLNPNNAKPHYMLGNVYHYAYPEFEKAKEEYGLAISLDPTNYIYYRRRGECYSYRYDTVNKIKAIEDFSKAIELNPKDIKSHEDRGNTYFYNKEYDKAIVDFTEVLLFNSNDERMYQIRGASYYKVKEYNKAIDDYSKAISINNRVYYYYSERGLVYTALGQYDNAIDDFNKAIQLDPDYYYAYIDRAECYKALNQLDKAKADQAKAEELKKKYSY